MLDETAGEPAAGTIQAARLREAREYLGLTREDVTHATGWDIARIAALEDGGTGITGGELRKLSRLYRRPIGWFTGQAEFHPSPDLLRRVEGLSPGDREAILSFAEFLEGAGAPPGAMPGA